MTLLIAIKDTGADGELVATARSLAGATGWEVRALHVRESDLDLGAGDLVDLEIVDLVGDPIEVLLRLARASDVDCIAGGLRPADKTAECPAAAGPVTRALLGQRSAPVLLVRPGMRPLGKLKRVLVPLEGTPSTSAAMQFAEEVLCRPSRELVMLNVATGRAPEESGSLPAPRFIDQEQYEWSEWQDEFAMRFATRSEGCRHRVKLLVGDPATVIVKEARSSKIDLMVLTWRGTFAAGRARTFCRLLETAPCPLVVVPYDWSGSSVEPRLPTAAEG